ncbi:uncharacterized protein METZ01_LOCUS344277, partial [marine metagenome]
MIRAWLPRWVRGAALLLALFLSADVAGEPVSSGEVLVRFAPGAGKVTGSRHMPTHAEALFPQRNAAKSALPTRIARWSLLRFDPSDLSPQELAVELLQQPEVEVAVANYLRRYAGPQQGDPLAADQWSLAVLGWDKSVPDASSVVVSIIDSGVDLEHPDLVDQLWNNVAELRGEEGVDDDGNGYVDDLVGWDFTDAPGLPGSGDYLGRDAVPQDESGHGTHVAGIIAAGVGNDYGVSGIAPSVQLMPLRAGFNISGSGFLQDDDIAAAIVYAVDNGADVINLSLGDPRYSALLDDVVRFANDSGVV